MFHLWIAQFLSREMIYHSCHYIGGIIQMPTLYPHESTIKNEAMQNALHEQKKDWVLNWD